MCPFWWWYGTSFLQMTLIGGLTDVEGVIGRIGDDVWWLDALRALRLLFTAFDAFVLFDELLLLLLLWLPLPFPPPDNACVGVTLMCDDFEFDVELLVELVVLLDPDADAEVELLRFDEPDDVVFELLRFVDDEAADVWCWSCCRHFARRFLNQTCKKNPKFDLIIF